MTKYPYKWNLKDTSFTKDKGTVFSCFSCGGGSTMGYKLAGFDVIGCNEIDPRVMEVYISNHKPKYSFLQPIQEFKNIEEFPPELYNLDILDGSPPCSTFSVAGSREEAWGKKKKFREGQSEQVLDTRFFDFISLAKRLQPKIVIAENVKGILLGNAIKYVQQIYDKFDDAGYVCQHWLLDASRMGVPQRRERVFFICLRKDLINYVPCQHDLFESRPILNLDFNEPKVLYKEFADYQGEELISTKLRYYWENRISSDDGMGDTTFRMFGKEKCFNNRYDKDDQVCHTLPATSVIIAYSKPVFHSKQEVCCISTFPQDYDFGNQKPTYICGMSVPPVMIAQITSKIYEQWLSKINK